MNISLPPFIPADPSNLESQAVATDKQGYSLTDQDMFRRFPGYYRARRKASNQVFDEFANGDTTLGPQIQSEMMTAGLTGALGNVGDSVGAIGAGSAGEADLAKNLGLGVMNFQDRNDAKKWGHLSMMSGLAPERQFGLTGPDVAQIDLANIAGQNNWNQQQSALDAQQQQYAGQQAAQKSQGQSAMIGAGATVLAGVLVAF